MALRSTAGGTGSYANIYYNSKPYLDELLGAGQGPVSPQAPLAAGWLDGLNPATGTRYTAWVYPGTSTLNLLEWSDWDTLEFLSPRQVFRPSAPAGTR